MNRLIVDLEATCSDCGEFPRHEMEIIEIGAVMIDAQNKVIGEFTTFIKPVRNPVLTDFCKKLTSIQQSDVDAAPVFNKALNLFDDWLLDYDKFIFCSWGDYDRNQLNKDCEYHGVKNILADAYHDNIKKLFGKSQGVKPCGLGKAINMCGMKFEGNAHRGIDDAKNMARIIEYIDGNLKIGRR